MARGVLTKGRKHRSRPGLVAQAPPQGLLGWEEGATSRQRAREGAAWGPLTGAEAWRGGCSQPWETPGRSPPSPLVCGAPIGGSGQRQGPSEALMRSVTEPPRARRRH